MDTGNDTDREARKGKGEGGKGRERAERTGRVRCQPNPGKMVTSCSMGPRDSVSK